jgi:hypothetical protein
MICHLSLLRKRKCPGGEIGRRADLKHQWIHIPIGSPPFLVLSRSSSKFSFFVAPNYSERAKVINPMMENPAKVYASYPG